MPVPTYLWQYIGIDFIGPLPESANQTGGYDMICQGYSLQLTGTRGLVGEGGIEGVVDAFRG